MHWRGRGTGEPLPESWRTTISGSEAQRFLVDPVGRSVLVGSGWGIPYPAARLDRFSMADGSKVASVLTRHQAVAGLAVASGRILASTDSRLFEFEYDDLYVSRQWDKRLVQSAGTVIPEGGYVVMANHHMPTVGRFDPMTGQTRRLKVGLQPRLFCHDGRLWAIAGFDGGIAQLDVERWRLTDRQATPPIAVVAVGSDVWAVLAGPEQNIGGKPPVIVRRPSNTIIRLRGGRSLRVELEGSCIDLSCDDAHGLIWAVVGDRPFRLVAISQASGKVVGKFEPPPQRKFCHLDASAGVAFSSQAHIVSEHGVVKNATATLVCHPLPAAL